MATIKDGKGTRALAAFDSKGVLKKHEFGRPPPGPNDISIDIKFCGMCHSDVHATNGDWGFDMFPMAPGHEIGGLVQSVGSDVEDFKVGDRVAVGCFVESCNECDLCKAGLENLCPNSVQTYASPYPRGKGHDECAGFHTNGGYSSQITVRKDFVFHVPDNMGLEHAGPLLCSGITTFGPLNRHVLQKGGGKSVGVVGFGGLGHMAVKLAKAMDCDVTVISRSTSKKDAAAALGADILAHSDEAALKAAAYKFDVVLDTVAVSHEIAPILGTLKKTGTYVTLGGVPQPFSVSAFQLLMNNYKIEGSLVGGIPETKKMLEFCAEHNIKPDITIIHAKEADAHFNALHDGTAPAKRAVIDMSTLEEL